MSPHNPRAMIDSLKKDKEEIQAMPKLPQPTLVEPPEVVADEEFDLDKELEGLKQVADQQHQAQSQARQDHQMTQEEALRIRILETLKNHPDAPSESKIAEWKQKFGEEGVQLIAFDDSNAFIYTFLTQPQWDKIQEISQKLQQQPNQNIEKTMREAVLKTAILWPRMTPQWFETCRAGLPQTLYDSILLSSYFLTPAHALSLTTRL